MTGDRVAAGARRIQGLPTALGYDAERVSRLVLEAADDCDRVAGVVRLDTNDDGLRVDIYAEVSLALGVDDSEDDTRDMLNDITNAVLRTVAAGVGEQQGGQHG